MNLVVIVPAYNEGRTIAATIRSIKDITLSPTVLVVNDGSDDDTLQNAKDAGADILVNHKINRGLGAAVRSGLIAARKAGADIVVKFDADLQHNADDIEKIIAPLLADKADIVYGNRFEKIQYTMPLVRRLGNKMFTLLMRKLTKWPLKDSQPGIFAVNDAYLKDFYLPGDYNYTQQVLLDAYHRGMRFEHVAVEFHKREAGNSFVSFKYPIRVLPQILLVIVGIKPLKVFGTLGISLFTIGSLIFISEVMLWMLGFLDKPVQHSNLVLGTTLFGLHLNQ